MCEIETTPSSRKSKDPLFGWLENSVRDTLQWQRAWEFADEPPKAASRPRRSIVHEFWLLLQNRMRGEDAKTPRACPCEVAEETGMSSR